MANITTTSLLATEAEEGAPALGGHAEESDNDLQSPLERLIAQSSSEQRGDNLIIPNEAPRINLWSPVHRTPVQTPKPSLITLAACVCCLLQTGFVWASFLSKSWLETRLYLEVDLPDIQIHTDDKSQLLHTTTLGSLLGNLLGAKQHAPAIALVLTSLVLPCLCAVTGAAWIVQDRKQNDKSNTSLQPSYPRFCIEYGARIAFSVFFIFCILTIGSSPLPVAYGGTTFVVVNQFEGGLAAYTLGMMLGLMVLALLRFGQGTKEQNTESTVGQHWQVRSNQLFTGIQYGHVGDNESQSLQTPLLQDDAENSERNALNTSTETTDSCPSTGLSFWKRVVLFELALASTILWIPSLFQPLFHLRYGGIVSDFITDVDLTFYLRDFAIELWKRGMAAGTNRFLLLIIESCFVQLVLGLPFLANLAAIGAWILEPHAGKHCRRLLYTLQPFLGTFVFGVALFCSIPTFEIVTRVGLDKFGQGICSKFEAVVGDACFAIQAEPSVGLWFVLGQSFALELLVVATLAWHR